MNFDLLLLRVAVVSWTAALWIFGICCALAGRAAYFCAAESLAAVVAAMGVHACRAEARTPARDELHEVPPDRDASS